MQNEKVRIFKSSERPKEILRCFKTMRERKELCDIIFRLENECVYAHRVILSAVIPYFRKVLSNTDEEDKKYGISMPDIEPKALKCLIDFAYSCEVRIDEQNVRSLLTTACHLGVDDVRVACCDFLADSVQADNVLSIRYLAQNLNNPQLLDIVDCYVKEHFREITQTETFLHFPSAYINEILDQDDLNVDTEGKVFEAVMKWVKYFPENRSAELPGLLRKIRMPLLQPVYLKDIVETEEIIRTSVLCRSLLEEARDYARRPQKRKRSNCSFSTVPRSFGTKPPVNLENEKHIYALDVELKFTVDRLNLSRRRWSEKGRYSFRENNGSLAELNNKLYYFCWGDTLECDLATNEYKFRESMPTYRDLTGAASFRNKIYVCGGKINNTACNAVDCFNPENGDWTQAIPMRTSRWGTCVVISGQYLYVLGGRDNSTVFACVERYDPLRDRWRTMSPMRTNRCFAGAATLNGEIYICGGRVHPYVTEYVATAEMYDPVIDKWTSISPMNHPVVYVNLLSCGKKLYALGGEDGKNLLSTEVYDPERDKWTVRPSDGTKVNISAAVVVSSEKS